MDICPKQPTMETQASFCNGYCTELYYIELNWRKWCERSFLWVIKPLNTSRLVPLWLDWAWSGYQEPTDPSPCPSLGIFSNPFLLTSSLALRHYLWIFPLKALCYKKEDPHRKELMFPEQDHLEDGCGTANSLNMQLPQVANKPSQSRRNICRIFIKINVFVLFRQLK